MIAASEQNSHGQPRHIAILTHEFDEFGDTNYFLSKVVEIWRSRGIRISVLKGPWPKIDADVAIMHCDMTVVPEEYKKSLRHFPIVLNGLVTDISKKHISANLVHRHDGYQGPVIVKTNRNFGGHREAEVTARRSLLRRCIHRFRRTLPWTFRAEIGVWSYPIYNSVTEVPLPIWFNPDLVVERFLPERQDEFYCMRTWLFLGEAELNLLMFANQPIIKSPVAVRIEEAEVPEELRHIRRKLGFDYGKLDYGIVDGRVVLYDANRTPAVGTASVFMPLFEKMADGIAAFIPGSTPKISQPSAA